MIPPSGDIVGWGTYLEAALKKNGANAITVVNEAVSGMSARTTYEQGKFDAVANQLIKNDFVLIELGRNDYVSKNNIGRQSCSPDQGINTTCLGGKKNFEAYIINAATSMQAKGAKVILASLLPLNPYGQPIWDFDPKESPPVFISYMKDAAQRVHAPYIDMYDLVMEQYRTLPEQTVQSFFGSNDSVHTNAKGASFVADIAAKALLPIISGSSRIEDKGGHNQRKRRCL